MIGLGFIASSGHVPAYLARRKEQNDVDIVAIADICDPRREIAKELLPEARIYTDAFSLLDSEEHLDFVDIATPPCDHATIAHAALGRGFHVLCEKPLTTTLEDAKSLLDHAEKAKRVLFPCHNYKHAPVVKAIREIIERGQIGKIRSVTLNTFRNTHAKGVAEWKADWRRESRYSGGGIAMDHASHSFYLMFDWLGSYPTHITAKTITLEEDSDTEDNFSAAITFPTGLAHVHLCWTAGVRKVMYTVQGEKGAITVDDDRLELAVQKKTGDSDMTAITWELTTQQISSHWMDASHASWFNSLFTQFKKAIERKEYVGREAQEACLCIELITTAYRSAALGCKELPITSRQ